MLQILGETLMIATRTDLRRDDHRRQPPRPLPRETEAGRAGRRGWLRIAGLLF